MAGARAGVGTGSIHYVVLPGLRRDELLEQPQVGEADAAAWWRLAGVA